MCIVIMFLLVWATCYVLHKSPFVCHALGQICAGVSDYCFWSLMQKKKGGGGEQVIKLHVCFLYYFKIFWESDVQKPAKKMWHFICKRKLEIFIWRMKTLDIVIEKVFMEKTVFFFGLLYLKALMCYFTKHSIQ